MLTPYKQHLKQRVKKQTNIIHNDSITNHQTLSPGHTLQKLQIQWAGTTKQHKVKKDLLLGEFVCFTLDSSYSKSLKDGDRRQSIVSNSTTAWPYLLDRGHPSLNERSWPLRVFRVAQVAPRNLWPVGSPNVRWLSERQVWSGDPW